MEATVLPGPTPSSAKTKGAGPMLQRIIARLFDRVSIEKVTSFRLNHSARNPKLVASILFFIFLSSASLLIGQLNPRDPGVRGGTIDAGQPLASMTQTPGAADFF